MLPPVPSLDSYGISAFGFLPNILPLEILPDPYYRRWEAIVSNLQALLLSRRLRHVINDLDIITASRLRYPAEWRRAYVLLSFMTHAYIWGGDRPEERVPPSLSIPFIQICNYLELPPVATYAGVCLWNFKPIFPDEPMDSLDNLSTLATFTGSLDESWFYLISVAIEARGGPTIPLMLEAIEAARANDSRIVTECLHAFAERLDELGSLLTRMYENCDPHVFYHRIRPFLAGSKNMADAGLPNGVIFDTGIGGEPYRQYGGGSNAQSSLIQFFDIVLGVEHRPTGSQKSSDSSAESDTEGATAVPSRHNFIHEMRSYMPGPHRRFLQHVSSVANIREYVEAHKSNRPLSIAYDACLAMVRALRDKHIQMVSRYIIVKSHESHSHYRSLSPKNAPNQPQLLNLANTQNFSKSQKPGSKRLRGTGGTSLIPFLKQARDETGEPAIDVWARRILSSRPAESADVPFFNPPKKLGEHTDGAIEIIGLAGLVGNVKKSRKAAKTWGSQEMGSVPQKVLNWLHGALNSEYRNVPRTYSDVAQTLAYNPNFALQTDVYTYENGRSSLLLNLRGTLPVSFRGRTYAFPISIWVPQEYPNMGPIGFVTPTKDMAVRPGQYVSGEGRIYHPYLAGWRNDRSNLNEFLSILQNAFTHEPPVIARQEQIPRQRFESQQNGAPPPIPPLPPELARSDNSVRENQSPGGSQPPPPPPKSFDTRGLSSTHAKGPPPLPHLPDRPRLQYNGPDPTHQSGYPRAPPSMHQQAPQRGSVSRYDSDAHSALNRASHLPAHQPWLDDVSPINPSSGQNTFQSDPAISNQPRYSQQGQRPTPSGQNPDIYSPMYLDHAQRPPSQPSYQQPPPQSHQAQRLTPQQSWQSLKPKAPEDLLTSPFETTLSTQPTNIVPPPIPPNPQKDALLSALSQTLTQQINSSYANNISALTPLRAQQAALTHTLNAINREIYQLNDLEAMLSSNENILHQAMRDADKVLEDAKRRTVPNIDEVLVAPTVIAGQLYQSVAEEKAIEESRAVLSLALDVGRIGSGVWAKQTRSLAREEFLKKALIKKISRGMAIPDEGTWT